MFTNRMLFRILIPIIIEQFLSSIMGTFDILMVSNAGSAAVSGVSLVDSITKLMLFLFTSIATGGTIVCAQYLGNREKQNSDRAGRQVLLVCLLMALVLMAVCLCLRDGILNLIFGSVEADVMSAAADYFLITAIAYPFIAVFNACAALYRAAGRTRLPMVVSALGNILNIIINAVLIFGFSLGAKGAAYGTLISFIFDAVVMLIALRKNNSAVDIGPLYKIRPDFRLAWLVIRVGLPTGIENAMFQFGKLIVQSTVSTLGTTAIAANAIVVVLEYMSSMPSTAIGTGMITVVGQCIGAGKMDEAKLYIKKLTLWASILLVIMDLVIFALTLPVCALSGLDGAATKLCFDVMLFITIVKPFFWPLGFIPLNGMKAAGDVKFAMVFSTISMWVLRVGGAFLLCRVMGVGLVGIWIAWVCDWLCRSVVYTVRYLSGRWTKFHVIDRQLPEDH